MKKSIASLLLLFLIVLPRSTVFAQENGSPSATVSPTPVKVEYTLPYPGLLPDNPLYFLKSLRDRLVTFFISDPLKKSSFYLLQSDKRLEASWYLLKKDTKHDDLALLTLSKSTNYLYMAVAEVKTAKSSGEETADREGKLQQAVLKHDLVVKDMMALPGLSRKDSFAAEEKRIADLEKVVSEFSSKQ